MTTDITTRETRAVQNFKRRAKQKADLISTPVIRENLTNAEIILAESGTGHPIRVIDERELIETASKMAISIARDMGVRHWDDAELMKHDSFKFYLILKKYYSDMTLKEVKTAFEMSVVGELDDYLPRGKDGKADKNHYQSFTIDYLSKILNAFRLKKNKVWAKAWQLLPEKTETVSAEERKQYRDSFIQDICKKFKLYKTEKHEPQFIAPNLVLKYFIDAEWLDPTIEVSKDDNSLALHKLMSDGTVGKFQKVTLNKDHDKVIARAERIAADRTIIEIFDRIITEKRTIESIIN